MQMELDPQVCDEVRLVPHVLRALANRCHQVVAMGKLDDGTHVEKKHAFRGVHTHFAVHLYSCGYIPDGMTQHDAIHENIRVLEDRFVANFCGDLKRAQARSDFYRDKERRAPVEKPELLLGEWIEIELLIG